MGDPEAYAARHGTPSCWPSAAAARSTVCLARSSRVPAATITDSVQIHRRQLAAQPGQQQRVDNPADRAEDIVVRTRRDRPPWYACR